MATKTRIRKVPCGKICVQHMCWGERMWAYWVTWKKSDMECIEKHLSGKRMVLAWDPVPAGIQKALPRSPSHAPEAGTPPQGWRPLVWGKSIPVNQFPGYFLESVQDIDLEHRSEKGEDTAWASAQWVRWKRVHFWVEIFRRQGSLGSLRTLGAVACASQELLARDCCSPLHMASAWVGFMHGESERVSWRKSGRITQMSWI